MPKRSLGVVIPTFNEAERIRGLLPELHERFKDDYDLRVVVVDDLSPDGTGEIAKQHGAIVPPLSERLRYGRSLCLGLCLAWYTLKCDLVAQMDADHPVDSLESLMKKMENEGCDLVVGREKGRWKMERKVTRWLCEHILRLKGVSHPTCGLRVWRGEVLERLPWRHVKAKDFSIQVELLFWAERNKFKICEAEFEGHKSGKHKIRTLLDWLITFARLLRIKYLMWWRTYECGIKADFWLKEFLSTVDTTGV